MAQRQNIAYLAWNRGLVDPMGLARADIKRLALSAEVDVNWTPRVLGSMMMRAGLGYTGASASNAEARQLPFVFSITDKASLELTNQLLRVWLTDTLITRPSVSSAVTNGNFDTDLTGWTDNDQAGATSAWVTGGYMGLTGTGTLAAIRDQTVTVAAGDQGVEHALRVVIQRGPVVIRVGTSTSDDSYVSETELGTGNHSLSFTPTGNFNIRFQSRLLRQVLVNSCNVESSGVMTLPTPWLTADLGKIPYDYLYSQSGDVCFVACAGYAPHLIERRATRSWSVVQYFANDGPFRVENVGPITMTAAAISGNTTLTASAAYFKSTHAPSTNAPGAIFTLTSSGQTVSANIAAENTFTNTIEVTGVSTSRSFTVSLTGTWVATVTLQRSFDDGASWIDVTTYTVNTSTTYSDGLDNQIVLYRIGVKTGAYTSGTVAATLAYTLGSIRGVGRVTAFTSSTVVDIEVIEAFGGTSATDNWSEGRWSDRRGWPSAAALYEGRLWLAGYDNVDGSISDAFTSFNPDQEGDSGPISRSIGSGPVETINWVLPLQRLVLGGQGTEFSCRSSSLDEPLTPSNFNIKPAGTQGSAAVSGVKIDSNGIFVQRGGTRVFQLGIDAETVDYGSTNLSEIVPDIGSPGIERIAVQRQPDTRVHFVRSDGTVAVLIFDKVEKVTCWLEYETDGEIEDVMVLPSDPGTSEDTVYYFVKRTINGSDVRYREKFALESECVGGTLNKQADAFVTFTNSPASATVTGLTHLVAEEVVVWADGICLKDASGEIETFTVNGSGEITLTNEGVAYVATTGVVGLAYTARWQSGKLVQIQAAMGPTVLNEHKKISGLGLIMQNVHPKGLEYGRDFTDMQKLPEVEEGKVINQNTVRTSYDQPRFEFPGSWGTDERLCLKAFAPRPVTILAATCNVESEG